MQLSDAIAEDKLTLDEVAEGIGVANGTVVKRYRDGQRIPSKAVMPRIVRFFGGRVTADDFYGVTELVEELRGPRLPSLPPGTDPYYAPERPDVPPHERKAA